MRPSLTLVTLGVNDLPRSIAFYRDGLGWKTGSKTEDGVAFFQLSGVVLSLFPRSALAQDANQSPDGTGFKGITLAHNAKDEAEVDAMMVEAQKAGATIVKPAKKTFWGGYGGYFADPDGHLWEVAHNPFWKLDAKGNIILP